MLLVDVDTIVLARQKKNKLGSIFYFLREIFFMILPKKLEDLHEEGCRRKPFRFRFDFLFDQWFELQLERNLNVIGWNYKYWKPRKTRKTNRKFGNWLKFERKKVFLSIFPSFSYTRGIFFVVLIASVYQLWSLKEAFNMV